MSAWIVVYVDATKSLLCKRYGDHYEVEAEATSPDPLKRIANQLNMEGPS